MGAELMHRVFRLGQRLGNDLLDQRDYRPAHSCVPDTTECQRQLDTLGRGKKAVPEPPSLQPAITYR
jgi:hypothetical protein